MAKVNIEVNDGQRVSEADAKKVPAKEIARTSPPDKIAAAEVEGQYPYWQYYRCSCSSVFRVLLDTDQHRYFRSPCCNFMYRA